MDKKRSYIYILAIVTACCVGVLVMVNTITYNRINESQLASDINDLVKIFPNGEFKEIDFDDNTGLIEKAFEAKGEGYVYKVNVQGYKDTITFMVGFNNEGIIVGYEVLYFNDTPGIGDAVQGDSFKESIIGKFSNDGLTSVSGATISSKAVISGIDAAKAQFNTLKGIEQGDDPIEDLPEVSLGTPIAVNDEILNRYQGEILSETSEGNLTTYHVAVNGYGLVDDDGSHGLDYSQNEYEIVADTESMTLVSITYLHFGDTKGFGDKTMNEGYYATFVGMSMKDYEQEADVVSGATMTSRSMINAIRIVMDALGEWEDE